MQHQLKNHGWRLITSACRLKLGKQKKMAALLNKLPLRFLRYCLNIFNKTLLHDIQVLATPLIFSNRNHIK